MVPAAAILVVTAVLTAELQPAAAQTMADMYNHTGIYYNIKVENRMAAKETMQIDCRVDFSLHFTLGPGQSGGGVFRTKDFYVVHRRRPDEVPRAYCAWAYAGNYMNRVVLFDVQWPEAARCSNAAGDDAARCTVSFDGSQVFVEAPGGAPRRLLGDVAIKRCKRHWFFGRVGSDCSLPAPRSQYNGYVVDGWWDYQMLVNEINNV